MIIHIACGRDVPADAIHRHTGPKDTTNKSAPSGARTPMPGASPTSEGHDRLMASVQQPTEHPLPICPTCGERATAADGVSRRDGILTGHYSCKARGHIWITRWLASA